MRRGVLQAGKAVGRGFRALAQVPAGLVAVFRSGHEVLRKPGTRLGLHGLALIAVLAAAVYAGLYVVPSGANTRPASAPSSAAPGGGPVEPPVGDSPQTAPPSAPPSEPPDGVEQPQDSLAGWADNLQHLEIPSVALRAYGYAELALAQQQPGCHLTWPTLAGIGRIESNHGRSHGAELLDDGRSNPPVIGLPLDGGPERKEIRDTDNGVLDGDTTYDRAVGAMQFIPTTWARWATDGDNDGQPDPFDIEDAALAAARYLCAGGRDLATGEGWTAAILSYNRMDSYVRDVFAAADAYGRASHGTR